MAAQHKHKLKKATFPVESPKVASYVQFAKVEQTTPSPFLVNFKDAGLSQMEDTHYVVLLGGETVNRCMVAEATMSRSSFEILGGVITDVHHIMVVGRIEGDHRKR